ncbi:hypothetical protein [Planococcus shixiaomingii]|uniref:hypothetical protein n=1 Tax=Planococcus shixiaomingii TaxID=3058393 RepID=UPI0026392359|nr:hypothetical protein [Planococcus sp. N022]WKA55001.1 hypothetical protein QWY21_01090 [Planococcus sp. N022]
MKKSIAGFMILLVLFVMASCSGTPISLPGSSEASWAYPFVKYEGASYEVTNEKVPKEDVGELLGEVKRNVSDMDTAENYVESDFDSVGLNSGAKLFTLKQNSSDKIVYEQDGKYFIARIPEMEE